MQSALAIGRWCPLGKSGFFYLRSAALRPVSQKTGSREQLRPGLGRKEWFSFRAKALTKAVAFLVQSCDVPFRVVLQKFLLTAEGRFAYNS
jgi:hypothetical protein